MLAVVNRKKHKVSVLSGELTETRARTFLESLFSGTGSWTALPEQARDEL